MKLINTIIIATVLAFAAGALGQLVNAEEYHPSQFATVVEVRTNYHYVTETQPVRVCRDVEIPIYEKQSGNSGDVLLGMILGGVSGKVITGDDGGAAVGAIAGALIGAEGGQKVVGYRVENVCETHRVKRDKRVIADYTITYMWMGILGETITWKEHKIGDEVPITVRIHTKPNFEIRG